MLEVLLRSVENHLLAEGTSKIKGTCNGSKPGKAGNGSQITVVRNQEATTDGLEAGEGQVVQIRAVDKCKSTASGSQVGSAEPLKSVRVEPNGPLAGGQGRHIDPADVSEGEIGSTLQVGEANLEVPVVGGERQGVSDIAHVIDVDGCQKAVVVDVHTSDSSQLDSGKTGQVCVGDDDGIGSRNTLVKVETLKSRETDPADSVDCAQGAHLKGGQDGETAQFKGSSDGIELIGRDGSQLSGISADQVTLDGLNAVELKNTRGLIANDYVSSV